VKYLLILKTVGTENQRFTTLYDEILEVALELNFLKNVYKVQNVGFLIDSAMSSHYMGPDNLFNERLVNASEIFKFQLMLGYVLETVIESPFTFLVQYDEQFAW